ncbi:MAG TPA: hypothetical protein VMX13_17845 [Sedimentisphaerales bacterium]|nr:hypothetical protein [Sedimentisphaerales bacterium]
MKEYKTTIKAGLILLPVFMLCEVGADEFTDTEKSARYVLSKTIESQEKLKNLQCDVTYRDFESRTAQERRLRQIRAARGNLKSLANALEERMALSENFYQTQKIIRDSENRAKIEISMGYFDRSGTAMPFPGRDVFVWDGEISKIYHEGPEHESHTATAVVNNIFNENVNAGRTPLKLFGGAFVERFAHAIDANDRNIEVKEDATTGTYEVTITGDSLKDVGIVDPGKGFSVVSTERYSDGILRGRFVGVFNEISGVWFPCEGNYETFFDDGEREKVCAVNASNISINDPNFRKNLFRMDFKDGTLVHDRTVGMEYVVGDPSRTRFLDDFHNEFGPIKQFEEVMKAVDETHTKEIFIPNAEIAHKEGRPFVLSLATSEMLNPAAEAGSEEACANLVKIGRGDLAWDGSVVTMRRAKALTVRQERHRPLKCTPGRWCNWDKLPDKAQLPYCLLVVTTEGKYYLITIHRIEPDGITIVPRKLKPDQVEGYLME